MVALLLAAVFAAASPKAAPPPPKPVLITEPDWLQKPDGETVGRAYPVMAQQLMIEGRAQINCRVNAVGRLESCKVAREEPTGLGFGDAALAMSSAFQMKPKTRNGEPVENGEVRIPLIFKLPKMEAPNFPEPTPTSPEALALAREYLTRTHFADGPLERWESYASTLETLERDDMSEAARAAAAAGVRAAAKARIPALQEEVAKLYAANFTAADLKAILAFEETPSGAVVMRNDADSRAIDEVVNREIRRLQTDEGRTVFCAEHDCPDPATAKQVGETRWAEAPDENLIGAFLPEPAKAFRLGGVATLLCNFNAQGYLPSCSVASEAPRGVGFGAAAVALRSYFRLSAGAIPDDPKQTVTVMVRFPTPEPEDAATAPTPRSAHAMALARDYLDASRDDAKTLAAWRAAVTDAMARSKTELLPADEMKVLMDTMARALPRAAQKARDFQAAYLTHRFTDEQLVAATAFFRSPAGRHLLVGAPRVNAETQVRGAWWTVGVLDDAGERMCKALGCSAKLAAAPQPASAAKPEASTRKP